LSYDRRVRGRPRSAFDDAFDDAFGDAADRARVAPADFADFVAVFFADFATAVRP
jgi:hypothetical protein